MAGDAAEPVGAERVAAVAGAGALLGNVLIVLLFDELQLQSDMGGELRGQQVPRIR